jgi:NAD(P)-dependent dehydrogenase (short-subunit alcohol dehydrogenase family)
LNATVEQAGSVASLDGKIVLVTGATSTFGIGRISARAMAMAGAYVYVTGRDPIKGAETVAEIEVEGGKASFLKLDVTIEAEWAQAMESVRQQFGRLDILVNNAGNTVGGPIEEMPLDDLWYMIRLNIEGAFLGTTYAWPLMQDAGGVILDINSVAGQGGSPGGTAYQSSKGALLGLSMAAAADGWRHGIRVISIHPGGTWTPGMERVTGLTKEEYDQNIRDRGRIPLGRGAESADVAVSLVYFASDEAKRITGIEYNIDGGSSAR